jgi:hypothetical protein
MGLSSHRSISITLIIKPKVQLNRKTEGRGVATACGKINGFVVPSFDFNNFDTTIRMVVKGATQQKRGLSRRRVGKIDGVVAPSFAFNN